MVECTHLTVQVVVVGMTKVALANGHVYVCNWTGHGWNDSKRGRQVLEFDGNGKVVWHLDDWEMFGSISGIDVIESP